MNLNLNNAFSVIKHSDVSETDRSIEFQPVNAVTLDSLQPLEAYRFHPQNGFSVDGGAEPTIVV